MAGEERPASQEGPNLRARLGWAFRKSASSAKSCRSSAGGQERFQQLVLYAGDWLRFFAPEQSGLSARQRGQQPGYTGSPSIRHSSIASASSNRTRKRRTSKSNWFWNFGPTFHYFFGEAFDNFTRVSARTRAGWRYKAIYFGGELDYFIPVIQHFEFGALSDGDLTRFSYGAFIGFEIRRIQS